MTSASSKTKTEKQTHMVRRGNCSNVKIWTLPLRDLVGIHTRGIPGWIVGVWQPPAGHLINPSSKRGPDRTTQGQSWARQQGAFLSYREGLFGGDKICPSQAVPVKDSRITVGKSPKDQALLTRERPRPPPAPELPPLRMICPYFPGGTWGGEGKPKGPGAPNQR